jgi:Kdo2-lipid IVA lauroyltransferase/acyltransferase
MRRMLRESRYRLEASALRVGAWLVQALPERLWWPAGRMLGALGFVLARRRRRVALANLRACCAGLGERELRALGRQSFQRLCWTFLEVLGGALGPRAAPLRRIELRGLEVLQDAAAEGRGVVLVASHLGNWELLGAVTAQLGFPHRTVSKRLKNPFVSEWIRALRESAGMDVVWAHEGASIDLLERLEAKGLVSVVTDQDARGAGVPARFLGKPVRAHRGAATLALAAECPLVLGTIVRIEDGRRHLVEYDRVEPPSVRGRLEDDVARLTQECLDRLGRKILEHPADYLWAHNRFKDRREDA